MNDSENRYLGQYAFSIEKFCAKVSWQLSVVEVKL